MLMAPPRAPSAFILVCGVIFGVAEGTAAAVAVVVEVVTEPGEVICLPRAEKLPLLPLELPVVGFVLGGVASGVFFSAVSGVRSLMGASTGDPNFSCSSTGRGLVGDGWLSAGDGSIGAGGADILTCTATQPKRVWTVTQRCNTRRSLQWGCTHAGGGKERRGHEGLALVAQDQGHAGQ